MRYSEVIIVKELLTVKKINQRSKYIETWRRKLFRLFAFAAERRLCGNQSISPGHREDSSKANAAACGD